MSEIDSRLLNTVFQDDVEETKKCIKKGANVNTKNKYGWTPLHIAASSKSEACCKVLLAYEASVDAADNYGLTPLHCAAESASEDCCRVLLDYSPTLIDAVDKEGATALHYATVAASERCCCLLMDYMPSVNAADSNGDTALHRACCLYNEDGDMRYYKVIIMLIHSGGEISLKNEKGKTPLDELGYFKRRSVQQEYEKSTLHRKLMAQGDRPVDVVKVFLCGDPSAGKTTIKNTLTKNFSVLSMLRRVTGSKKKEEIAGDYIKTPGIDVDKQSVKGVGQFLFWDCAGQIEYSITHGMFLGSRQSIFVLVYDLEKVANGEKRSTPYWLSFIRATRGQNERPHVILVGSHVDKVQWKGKKPGSGVLKFATGLFADTLNIDDALVVLDAREEKSEGMDLLKDVLKRLRKEITGTKKVPKLCDELEDIIKPWREEEVPVIGWKEYLKRVRQTYPGMDKDTLQAVSSYLHMMGEVYWAKFEGREDLIILNTQWFTSHIIGAAFAGKGFDNQFAILPDQPCYSQQQLCDFFTKKIDTSQLLSLLNHMDLVHNTDDKMYLLPGKLPTTGPEVEWDIHEVYEVKGRSIECFERIDTFNPNVFPCVQKKILDEKQYSTTYNVSRSAVKCVIGTVQVFIQLTKHKRSINIAVLSHSKDTREEAYASLEHVFELIKHELLRKSPGTNLQHGYISQSALRSSNTLEDVWSFTRDNLTVAEAGSGFVTKVGTSAQEDVSKILFQGYDKMFLQEFGSRCRYEWLPINAVTRCFGRLDRINEWGEDYRAVGKVLGIPKHEVEQLAEVSKTREESATDNIIKKWCKNEKRKMTIGMLQKLLRRLSLVENEDALKAIDEVIEMYTAKNIQSGTGDMSFEIGMSEYLARWRQVLKRLWSVLKVDIDPNMLTSRLHYLPLEVCAVLEGTNPTDVKQRINNAETLLQFLLQRDQEDWPTDLVKGLRETDQRPLAETLEEKYEEVVRDELACNVKRRPTLQDAQLLLTDVNTEASLKNGDLTAARDSTDKQDQSPSEQEEAQSNQGNASTKTKETSRDNKTAPIEEENTSIVEKVPTDIPSFEKAIDATEQAAASLSDVAFLEDINTSSEPNGDSFEKPDATSEKSTASYDIEKAASPQKEALSEKHGTSSEHDQVSFVKAEALSEKNEVSTEKIRASSEVQIVSSNHKVAPSPNDPSNDKDDISLEKSITTCNKQKSSFDEKNEDSSQELEASFEKAKDLSKKQNASSSKSDASGTEGNSFDKAEEKDDGENEVVRVKEKDLPEKPKASPAKYDATSMKAEASFDKEKPNSSEDQVKKSAAKRGALSEKAGVLFDKTEEEEDFSINGNEAVNTSSEPNGDSLEKPDASTEKSIASYGIEKAASPKKEALSEKHGTSSEHDQVSFVKAEALSEKKEVSTEKMRVSSEIQIVSSNHKVAPSPNDSSNDKQDISLEKSVTTCNKQKSSFDEKNEDSSQELESSFEKAKVPSKKQNATSSKSDASGREGTSFDKVEEKDDVFYDENEVVLVKEKDLSEKAKASPAKYDATSEKAEASFDKKKPNSSEDQEASLEKAKATSAKENDASTNMKISPEKKGALSDKYKMSSQREVPYHETETPSDESDALFGNERVSFDKTEENGKSRFNKNEAMSMKEATPSERQNSLLKKDNKASTIFPNEEDALHTEAEDSYQEQDASFEKENGSPSNRTNTAAN